MHNINNIYMFWNILSIKAIARYRPRSPDLPGVPGIVIWVVFYCNYLQGAVCANPCPAGTFGLGCRQKCECYNAASCDHVNGTCQCRPGYSGKLVSSGQTQYRYFLSSHLLQPFYSVSPPSLPPSLPLPRSCLLRLFMFGTTDITSGK